LHLDTSQVDHYISLLQQNPLQIPVQLVSDGTISTPASSNASTSYHPSGGFTFRDLERQ